MAGARWRVGRGRCGKGGEPSSTSSMGLDRPLLVVVDEDRVLFLVVDALRHLQRQRIGTISQSFLELAL